MLYISGVNNSLIDCCGSALQYQQGMKAVTAFSKQAVGQSFFISRGLEDSEDSLPPNRISDLRVVRKIKSSLDIQLEWTAPGGDQDYGKGLQLFYLPKETKRKVSYGVFRLLSL